VFVPRYSETEAREAIAASLTWTEALRRLGRCPTGGASSVLKRWAAVWEIPVDHFDANAARSRGAGRRRRDLTEILVPGSTVSRAQLKRRLYDAGLKSPRCEICGQGEQWRGRRLSLVLDHVNGVRDDNRLENLRILCPNCNATLDTHCGKASRVAREPIPCARCGELFEPKRARQRYCSAYCGSRHGMGGRSRTASAPPDVEIETLLEDVHRLGYVRTGAKYGVSDNAVRKWLRKAGVKPPPGLRPTPPRRARLSDAEARRALELLAAGASRRSVAAQLSVSRWCIQDLAAGRTYKHVERPGGSRNGHDSTDLREAA
jgi:hypothetical protein